MPIIKPISELRNKTKEITEICKKLDEPVFLTHNGHGSLVVMTVDHYEKQLLKEGLAEKLAEAEKYWAKGGKGIPHKEVMRRLKSRVRGR